MSLVDTAELSELAVTAGSCGRRGKAGTRGSWSPKSGRVRLGAGEWGPVAPRRPDYSAPTSSHAEQLDMHLSTDDDFLESAPGLSVETHLQELRDEWER